MNIDPERRREAVEALRLALLRCEQTGVPFSMGWYANMPMFILGDCEFDIKEGVSSLRLMEREP